MQIDQPHDARRRRCSVAHHRAYVVVFAAALLAACNPHGLRVSPAGTGTITGRVADLNGRPVAGATARVAGRARAVSDARGVFSFNVQPGAPVAVEVASTEYVTGNALFPVAAGQVSVRTITLIPRAPARRLDARAGGDVPLAGGAGSVSFAPGSLVDAAGRPATGDVFVRATYIDPRDPRQVRAAPGNYVASDSVRGVTRLATRGMVDVAAMDGNGEMLRLAPDRTAAITWPANGSADGALYLMSPTGFWVSEGPISEVTAIRRIGTWNWDNTFSFACMRVATSPAMAGVLVTAVGVAPEDYANDAYTDQNGVAVLAVKPSTSVTITTSPATGAPAQMQTPSAPVFAAGTPARCPPALPVSGTLRFPLQFDRRLLDGIRPRDGGAVAVPVGQARCLASEQGR